IREGSRLHVRTALAIDRDLDPAHLLVGLAGARGVRAPLVDEGELPHVLERRAPALDGRALPRVEHVHASTRAVARAADRVEPVDRQHDADALRAAVGEPDGVAAPRPRLEVVAA